MRIKLTKRVVDALPIPLAGKRATAYDAELRGFGATKHSTGQTTFFVEWSHRRMAIGTHGPLTVEQARKEALRVLAGISRGQDPLEERHAAREVPVFSAWAKEYLEDVRRRKRSRKSIREDERLLNLAVAAWGKRPLTAITTRDVERYFQRRADKHGHTTANRWLACVRTCFEHAWRAERITENPAARVRPLPENPPRSRVLTDDELGKVIAELEKLKDPHVRLAFELLLTTGARKSEVLRARWEDLDLGDSLWRLPDTKSGRPQVIPLPQATAAMLRNTPKVGPWVVPGRDQDKPRDDLRKPWAKLRTAAGCPDVTIHDVRRTFGLHAAKSAGLHVASKLLRHSTVRITEQVYAPLGMDDLRKATEAVGRTRAKVIKLRRKEGGEA